MGKIKHYTVIKPFTGSGPVGSRLQAQSYSGDMLVKLLARGFISPEDPRETVEITADPEELRLEQEDE